GAPDRLQQLGPRGVALELLAQAADVDGHGPRVESGRVAPDLTHQLVAREDASGVGGEEPEQIEFLCGEADQLAVPARLAPRRVQLEAANRDPFARRPARAGTAEHRLHARRQLAWGEGLRDIVVGAQLESDNAVGL